MSRIPSWWLSVGADDAWRVQELFVTVMAELPISHAALAGRLRVSPSTVTRWSNGAVTPQPRVMLAAVAEARSELAGRLERAAEAEKALQELVAADQPGANPSHQKKLRAILDQIGVQVPQERDLG